MLVLRIMFSTGGICGDNKLPNQIILVLCLLISFCWTNVKACTSS